MLWARLAEALELVLDTRLGLTAIALEVGFSSHSHLTARFRSLFGVSPAELRRRARSNPVAELRKIVIAEPSAHR